MRIKRLIKSLLSLSPFIKCRIDAWVMRRHLELYQAYANKRWISYAGYLHPEREGNMQAQLIFNSHRIEKGLTMPHFRYAFGAKVISLLSKQLWEYRERGYDRNHLAYVEAMRVLKEYREVHQRGNATLGADVISALSVVDTEPALSASSQICISEQEYWANLHADFAKFAYSRHSVRDLHGQVPMESIVKAVELANTAPSACNRQFARVHYYCDKELIQNMLRLQNGNAGFGSTVEQLILVTSDMEYAISPVEVPDLFLNAGIYIMNLSYSLHYNRVAHCLLNWMVDSATDRSMRALANIPGKETIHIVIACGQLPAQVKVTASPRLPVKSVLSVH